MSGDPTSLEDQWELCIVKQGIRPLIDHLNNDAINNIHSLHWFERHKFMEVYSKVYELCRLRGENNASMLYEKHNNVFKDYYEDGVLPDLQNYQANDQFL